MVAVEREGEGSQSALRAALDSHPALNGPDRGFCTELVYGVLRRRRALDRWIAGSCRQGLFDLDEPALAVLRIGALQLADLRVPDHAAVHATVETAKRVLPAKQVGFVHAVLRNLAARLSGGAGPDHDDLPEWLGRRVNDWAARTGVDPAALRLAQSQPAPLFVHALDGDLPGLQAKLSDRGIAIEPLDGVDVPGVGRARDGSFFTSASFVEREALAQDAASAAVVEWLVDAIGAQSSAIVADVAAGRGVKSARLVQTGAAVTAMDLSAAKLEQAAALCSQTGHPLAATIAGDATHDLGLAPGSFDAILLDAPCTALGTLRRRPELRHRRMAADILRMADLQARLLRQAAVWLRPGGTLVYAVCSFAAEEGPLLVDAFLASHPEFSRNPGDAAWLNGWLDDRGDLVSSPLHGGADGFFAARLKKAS